MPHLPIAFKQLFMPLTIIVISCIFWFFEPSSNEWFDYNRNLISAGQWWRLITGHLLHTNTNHLLLNLAGLTLIWALHGDYFNFSSIFVALLLCLGTSIGLYFFSVDLISYVGLSGILHGFFIIGAWQDMAHKVKGGWILFVAVWLKVIYEQLVGPSEGIAILINASVAIDAHLFGTIAGTMIVIFYLIKDKVFSPLSTD